MRPSGWHISPAQGEDPYKFLRVTAQEWQFLVYADALGLPQASKATLAGAKLARDDAVDYFNRWMHKRRGLDWFQVSQHHTLEEDYRNERRGIFLMAGSSVLVAHRCESALAHVARQERPIFGPDGTPVDWIWEEQVVLHCIQAPPKDDTLKVLPVHVVPRVSVFNH